MRPYCFFITFISFFTPTQLSHAQGNRSYCFFVEWNIGDQVPPSEIACSYSKIYCLNSTEFPGFYDAIRTKMFSLYPKSQMPLMDERYPSYKAASERRAAYIEGRKISSPLASFTEVNFKELSKYEASDQVEPKTNISPDVGTKSTDHGYFTETNRIYTTPPAQVNYNIKSVTLDTNSPEGKFLLAENQKFNISGQNAQAKTNDPQESSTALEDQQLYVKQSARRLLSEYRHEPSATEVLDRDIEESGNKESWRDAFKKGFKWIFDTKKINNLLVNRDGIPDPNVRQLIKTNTVTINLFNYNNIYNIINNLGPISEGSTSSQALNSQLDRSATDLRNAFIEANARYSLKQTIQAFDQGAGNSTAGKMIISGMQSSVASIFSLPQ